MAGGGSDRLWIKDFGLEKVYMWDGIFPAHMTDRVDRKQMVQGFGEIYWFLRKVTATPMSAACTPTERAKFLQYSARPSQCILQAQGCQRLRVTTILT